MPRPVGVPEGSPRSPRSGGRAAGPRQQLLQSADADAAVGGCYHLTDRRPRAPGARTSSRPRSAGARVGSGREYWEPCRAAEGRTRLHPEREPGVRGCSPGLSRSPPAMHEFPTANKPPPQTGTPVCAASWGWRPALSDSTMVITRPHRPQPPEPGDPGRALRAAARPLRRT